jgi:hypothetical protein
MEDTGIRSYENYLVSLNEKKNIKVLIQKLKKTILSFIPSKNGRNTLNGDWIKKYGRNF